MVAAEDPWLRSNRNAAALRTVQTPVLVMVGRRDVITPPANSRPWPIAAEGAVAAVPAAGHSVLFQAPQESATAITAFLDGAPRRPYGLRLRTLTWFLPSSRSALAGTSDSGDNDERTHVMKKIGAVAGASIAAFAVGATLAGGPDHRHRRQQSDSTPTTPPRATDPARWAAPWATAVPARS